MIIPKICLVFLALTLPEALCGVLVPQQIGAYAPHYSSPKYAFKYGVSDPHTGDHKTQEEQRVGDVVKGQYSLVEPDGSVRTVDYTADPINGFNAVVSKTGPSIHLPTKHVVPAVPIVKQVVPVIKTVQPLIKAIPVTSYVKPIHEVVPSHYQYDYGLEKAIVEQPIEHIGYSNTIGHGKQLFYGDLDYDQNYGYSSGYELDPYNLHY